MIDPQLPYPSYDVQDPDVLIGLTGSFLSETYEGRAELREILRARGLLAEENYQRLRDGINSVSRLTTPVLRRKRWKPVRLLLSKEELRLPVYGQSFVYGGNPQITYGEPYGRSLIWEGPGDLYDCGFIASGVTAPSVTLLAPVDFVVTHVGPKTYLHFRVDPFACGLPGENLGDEDKSVTLWLYQPDFDDNFFYRQWGYILGFEGRPTIAYRDTVNAVFDALTVGSSGGQLRQALQASSQIPLVASDGEVVEKIATFGNQRYVATNANLYVFSSQADVVVAVGDTLDKYDSLTDALTVVELNRGEVPEFLTELTLNSDLLTIDSRGEIVFVDAELPWIGEVVDGNLRLSLELGGFPLAVEDFWDEVHNRGLASGTTLAETLDVRPTTARETPVALENIPPFGNPLKLLLKNYLRYNVAIARIKVSASAALERGALRADVIRRMLPPETLVIVLLELPSASTSSDEGEAELDEYDPADDATAYLDNGTADSEIREMSGYCL